MNILYRSIIISLSSLVFAVNSHALTAAQVFEKASKNVVVITANVKNSKAVSLGSGIVLPNGNVATNFHVIEKSDGIMVHQDGRSYPATALYTDPERDVCTLNVPSMRSPAVSMGDSKSLKIGARVYAIGAPEGLVLTLSEGIISSLRPVQGGHYLQITAPISHGSSGGGLFDDNGNLIGLTTFGAREGQQLNFAIPVEWINELPARDKKSKNKIESYVSWLNKAVELENKKDWQGLINHSLKRVKSSPDEALSWYDLGIAYDHVEQYLDAIEAYRHALQIDTKNADAWHKMGMDYYDTNQKAKAIEAYRQGISITPKHEGCWLNMGTIYDQMGEKDKAIDAYNHALKINPNNSMTLYNLGTAHYEKGRYARAIELLLKAVRLNPKHARSWHNLGNSYFKLKKYDKAVESFEESVRLNPDFIESWNNLGLACANAGRLDRGREAYKKALSLNPMKENSWFGLGLIYKVAGETQTLTSMYDLIKTFDPAMAERFYDQLLRR